jgi:hypothetical protein
VPLVVDVLQLDLDAFVEQVPLLGVLVLEVGDCLVDLGLPVCVPGCQFLLVQQPDLALDEVRLGEAEWGEEYFFCLDMWCSISRRFSSW